MLRILAISLALWCSAAQTESRPNILLLMADDLGFSELGQAGYNVCPSGKWCLGWDPDHAFFLPEGGASHYQPLVNSRVRVEKQGRVDNKPFFAWTAYAAPRWSLHAPQEYINEAIRQQRQTHLQDSDLFVSPFPFPEPAEVPGPPWRELMPEEKARQARNLWGGWHQFAGDYQAAGWSAWRDARAGHT